VALLNYEKAQKFNDKSALLNMKIGACYLYSSEKQKAISYIKKAKSLNPECDPMLDFYLGMTSILEKDYASASKSLKKFKLTKEHEDWSRFVTEYLYTCKEAPARISKSQRVWVDNVKELNSDRDDFSPCLSVDGESLIFTSNRSNGHQTNEFGEYDNDIYQTEYKNGKWTSPVNIGAPLSTTADEGTGAFSYDGQRLLIHRVNGDNFDIYESTLDGKKWTKPEIKMAKLPNRMGNDQFACYEPLDIKVHFITDVGVSGGKNIFMSGIMEVQNIIDWGKAQSVGHQVNTKFHENSIYIHPNGKTMYFSSQGHRSTGGYDIYKSVFENGQWGPPTNMGYPINTPYDDFFWAGTANGKYAYISSNRPGGKGGLDLYRVTFWGPPKEPDVDNEDYLLASILEPVKEVQISKSVKVERNSLTVFKGKVIDNLTKKPVGAEIEIIDNSKNEVINELNSNSATGKFLLSLPSGKNYGIAVKSEGYLFHSENFDLPSNSDFNLVNKDIELKNIAIGSKITLKNVFFATGKSDLKPESYPELDRVTKLLKDVASLKIELSGHTDNTGSESLNKSLSQKRAESVKQYLVKKGVSAGRLTAKGYGSSKPVDSNKTSEGRQNNRRTEFEIKEN
jgi:outer membrane protein OmpA-like peptidoglycan-associated protein